MVPLICKDSVPEPVEEEKQWRTGRPTFTWKTTRQQTTGSYHCRRTSCDSPRASGSGSHFRRSHRTRTACRSDFEGQSATDERKTNTDQARPATDRHLCTTVSAVTRRRR